MFDYANGFLSSGGVTLPGGTQVIWGPQYPTTGQYPVYDPRQIDLDWQRRQAERDRNMLLLIIGAVVLFMVMK